MGNAALDLSRIQFAVTTIFHMIWPLLSIGLSVMMAVMEILWLRTKDELYYRHVRFWSGLFIMIFGIGVASGVPLEFQFGMNWSRFSTAAGSLFGNILAFEASMSFALEAAFLAILIFGWNRVSRGMHLFSNIMVAVGASLSAFWIMGANSWMQVPAGVVMEGGRIVIVDYLKAVFNPVLLVSFLHIWVASVETTLFFVGGICAWHVVRYRNTGFFLKAFKIVLVLGIAAAPLQIFLGDASGLSTFAHQPAKAAAMEANWETNPPGKGAPWAVVAWPDERARENRWALEIPNLLSILNTRTSTGRVDGLRDFPASEQPPVWLTFYSFRIMVLLGFVMLGLVVWAVVAWARGRLTPDSAPGLKGLWR
jgi:cytochrome d ubiquinol oxidase subunit I